MAQGWRDTNLKGLVVIEGWKIMACTTLQEEDNSKYFEDKISYP